MRVNDSRRSTVPSTRRSPAFGLDGPTPLILFRESTVAGRFVGITAIDGVDEHVILRSGRLPRTCTPDRCEVLRLRGRGALPSSAGLRIVEVGTATLRSRQLYGDFLLSSDAATADATVPPELGETSEYHRPPPAPLVVAEGRAALASATALARTYRTYAWVWPIGPGNPRLWDVDELVQRTERARIELTERSSSFAVEGPVDELREIERSAKVAGTRLLLVGGEGAALLLAFTILAARGMRRDLEAARRRLTWFGAQRWQLWLLGGVESSVVALVGVVLGWIAGIVVAGIVAGLAGAPVLAVLSESVLSPVGLGVAAAAALVAAVLVWITVSLPQREGARIGALDLVAAAAVLVVAVALVGGAADEEQLARGEGTALLLLLLPGLIAIAAALVVARIFPALARFWADRGSADFRLGSRPSGWRAGRAPQSRPSRSSPSPSRSRFSRRGIERRSYAVIESRLRSRCRTTWLCARISGTWFVSSMPHRSRASTSSSARAARRVRCFGWPVGRVGPSGSAASPCSAWTRRRSRPSECGGTTGGPGEEVPSSRPSSNRTRRWRCAAFRSPTGGSSSGWARASCRSPRSSASWTGRSDGSSSATLVRAPERPANPHAPGSLLTRLDVEPPPRLIERGADAGVAFFATVRLSGLARSQLRDWIGIGGSVPRPTPNGVSVRVPLTLQRTSGLRAPQPTDESPPAVLVTPRLAELAEALARRFHFRWEADP